MTAMTTTQISILGGYLFAIAFCAVAAVCALWPPSEQLKDPQMPIRVFGRQLILERERHILLLVIFMGIMGGSAWALWFFAKNAAEGAVSSDGGLKEAQFVWYVLRPWTSSLMTLVFYGIVRSGLFIVSVGDAKLINVYGMCGLAGAAGFSANELFEKFSAFVSKVT